MKLELIHYPNLKIDGLLPRDVWVWTPPQYQQEKNCHFPVLYMHDGQNLFDPKKSYTHITWGVAEVITKLSTWGFIRPAIVVGIDNTPNRFGDYLPTDPFVIPEGKAFLASQKNEMSQLRKNYDFVADTYLKLIVDVIKPMIDHDFRVSPSRQDTIIMGSSMGGLISIYALIRHPQIFGGAGCLSTSWPALEHSLAPYLQAQLPSAGHHKMYFDHGSQEMDANYAPFQNAVDNVMRDKGYTPGEDWITHIAPGAHHNEKAWRNRIHLPLRFFLGKG